MKTQEKLAELSLEQLIEKRRKLKNVYAILGIFMTFVATFLIYLAVKTKNYALIVVALGSSLTFLTGLVTLSAINTEIKNRSKV